MGLPICLFAYGTKGLGIGSAIFCVIILFHFTIGVLLADKKFSLKPLIRNGPFYAIFISLIFLYYNFELPKFVENTTMLFKEFILIPCESEIQEIIVLISPSVNILILSTSFLSS